jgi:hypothetical protein
MVRKHANTISNVKAPLPPAAILGDAAFAAPQHEEI